jgi:hypothetical protein
MERSMVDQHYTVSTPHFDDGFTIGKQGMLRLFSAGAPDLRYWLGEFMDERGTVTVYRQHNLVHLDFAVGRRVHTRTWQSYLGDRTIARLARAFISDVLAQSQPTPSSEISRLGGGA